MQRRSRGKKDRRSRGKRAKEWREERKLVCAQREEGKEFRRRGKGSDVGKRGMKHFFFPSPLVIEKAFLIRKKWIRETWV